MNTEANCQPTARPECPTRLKDAPQSTKYTEDAFKNFKLRVVLRKKNLMGGGDEKKEMLQRLGAGGNPNSAQQPALSVGNSQSHPSSPSDTKMFVREFGWQERVLGTHEIRAVSAGHPPNQAYKDFKHLAIAPEHVAFIRDPKNSQLDGEVLFSRTANDRFEPVRSKLMEEHQLFEHILTNKKDDAKEAGADEEGQDILFCPAHEK